MTAIGQLSAEYNLYMEGFQMLNKAILMGRLTRDPELKQTQSGTSVCSFSVAVDRNFKGADGERQTDFISCVAWRSTAEFISKWFGKGAMIVVVGSIQTRRYQDKNGNDRTATEVIVEEAMFGESRRDSQGGAPALQPAQFEDIDDEDEEELPF